MYIPSDIYISKYLLQINAYHLANNSVSNKSNLISQMMT